MEKETIRKRVPDRFRTTEPLVSLVTLLGPIVVASLLVHHTRVLAHLKALL